MTKQRRPSVLLELHYKKHRWLVRYARPRKDGSRDWADWNIHHTSSQPRPVFFTVMNMCIFPAVSKIENKSFTIMEPKILEALREAAKKCGCTATENKFHGIHWSLRDGKPYADFAIVNYEMHRDKNYRRQGLARLAGKLRASEKGKYFRRMEHKSRALYRIGLVVLKNGFIKFLPGTTLPEEDRKWKKKS